ncbi:hypothetical protein DFH08DRAFT_817352 [Mycena albidolilacea]|uniref:Uncharacterized protein n=1 Tax=Mycena albidolilacea TaxID=1033008 RepID=A0AAD6ZIM9_9AGAR|nr:hypothetical protein DFH08DRAFT_817352 [Mycena albidolilacea]
MPALASRGSRGLNRTILREGGAEPRKHGGMVILEEQKLDARQAGECVKVVELDRLRFVVPPEEKLAYEVEASNVGSELLPGDHLQEMSKSVVIQAYGGGVMKQPPCIPGCKWPTCADRRGDGRGCRPVVRQKIARRSPTKLRKAAWLSCWKIWRFNQSLFSASAGEDSFQGRNIGIWGDLALGTANSHGFRGNTEWNEQGIESDPKLASDCH